MKAEVGKRYRHYRNKEEYIVRAIGRDSNTLIELVIYEGQYESPEFGKNPVWVRPRPEFEERIAHEGVSVQRFERIE